MVWREWWCQLLIHSSQCCAFQRLASIWGVLLREVTFQLGLAWSYHQVIFQIALTCALIFEKVAGLVDHRGSLVKWAGRKRTDFIIRGHSNKILVKKCSNRIASCACVNTYAFHLVLTLNNTLVVLISGLFYSSPYSFDFLHESDIRGRLSLEPASISTDKCSNVIICTNLLHCFCCICVTKQRGYESSLFRDVITTTLRALQKTWWNQWSLFDGSNYSLHNPWCAFVFEINPHHLIFSWKHEQCQNLKSFPHYFQHELKAKTQIFHERFQNNNGKCSTEQKQMQQ